MKKNLFPLIFTLIVFCSPALKAQSPDSINYQAIARNVTGAELVNRTISVKFVIHQSMPGGSIVYTDTHPTVITNAFGLFSIYIGQTGGLNTINWGKGPYFLEVDVDTAGANSNYLLMGTTQFVSVPYAFYSNRARIADSALNGPRGDSGARGPMGFLQSGASAGNTPYWNGSNWVLNSSNIFNNGGNVGVGTASPVTPFQVIGKTTTDSLAIIGSNPTIPGNVLMARDGFGDVKWGMPPGLPPGVNGSIPYYNGSWVVNGSNVYDLGGNIGIGTGTPTTPLQVKGKTTTDSLAIIGSNPVIPGDVLVARDPSGDTRWASPLGFAWLLKGNIGTNPAVNFMGTTDNVDVIFKRHNILSGMLDSVNNNTSWGVAALDANTATYNTAVGCQALFANTLGGSNTAVGAEALASNTQGNNNTAVGHGALQNNTAGNNTAVGYNALISCTVGSPNTAVGYLALSTVAGGVNNVAVGNRALQSTTTSQNTAMGSDVMQNNTTGISNTAMGFSAILNNASGSFNTGIGDSALFNNSAGNNAVLGASAMVRNTSGTFNTSVGTQSLYYNTTGNNNTALGWQALAGNTTYGDNTGIGYQALVSNASFSNTAVGSTAMKGNTSGADNTAVGYNALGGANTGSSNNAFGLYALNNNTSGYENTADGVAALQGNTNGAGNTGVGWHALISNVTGFNNTALGYNAGTNSSALSNTTALGNGALATVSNSVVLGNASVTQTQFNGALMPYYTGNYQSGNAGQVLVSQGANTAPQWSSSTYTGAIVNEETIGAVTNTPTAFPTTYNFTKKYAATTIEITLEEPIIVSTMLTSGVIFEVRVNGVPASIGNAKVVYLASMVNTQQNITIYGIWTGLPVGVNTISIVAYTPTGTATGATNNSGGWYPEIIVKESF